MCDKQEHLKKRNKFVNSQALTKQKTQHSIRLSDFSDFLSCKFVLYIEAVFEEKCM